MSRTYKNPECVPSTVLADRLDALVGVLKNLESRNSELTMRIPAECDRDFDIVLSEAARRLRIIDD